MSTVSGLTPAVIVSLIAVGFSVLVTWAGVIIWAMRQEGRINLANERIDHFNDKLASSVAALAKFDENTQSQVENYQQNTERKIDELGRNMSAKFEKVFDKLDQKVDKD
jgi:predicted PurR-regulated permease PerM